MSQHHDNASRTTESHFLSHPEVHAVFHEVLSILVSESDRGAVLVGTSLVDQHLGRLFEHVAPADMGKKAKALLSYPGPLSTLAAKVDVARAVGLIGSNVHQAIHRLRKLRNDVAHSPHSFKLDDHREALHAMATLGPGLPEFLNRMAMEYLLTNVVERLKDLKIDLPGEEAKQAFESPLDVLEQLEAIPEAMAALHEKATRLELGLSVAFICALIVHHRDRRSGRLGSGKGS